MNILSLTTEDVLGRVSDEVQGFFFEELEKIAQKKQVVQGLGTLLDLAQQSHRAVPDTRQVGVGVRMKRKHRAPTSPSDVFAIPGNARGQPVLKTPTIADLPPLETPTIAELPPLKPLTITDPPPLKPTTITDVPDIDVPDIDVPTPQSIKGQAPEASPRTDAKASTPTSRAESTQTRILDVRPRLAKLDDKDQTAWKRGLQEAYEAERERLGIPKGEPLPMDRAVAVQNRYLKDKPLPAADAPASSKAKTPEEQRAERIRQREGAFVYDLPKDPPASSGEPDPDDFFASSVRTPENIRGSDDSFQAGGLRARIRARMAATGETFGQARQAISRAISEGPEAASAMAGAVRSAAGRAGQAAVDTGSDLVHGVTSGTARAGRKAKQKAKDTAQYVEDKTEQVAEQVGRGAARAGRAAGSIGRAEANIQASYMGGLLDMSREQMAGLSLVRQKADRANQLNERIRSVLREGSRDGVSEPKAGFMGLSKARANELKEELAQLRGEKAKIIQEIENSDVVDDAIKAEFKTSFEGDGFNTSASGFAGKVSGDDGIRMFGGTPTQPRVASMLGDIIRMVRPDAATSRQAGEAAEGLGKALSEINPAYLAAAAGATGVVGGMVVGSGGPSQPQSQYGY